MNIRKDVLELDVETSGIWPQGKYRSKSNVAQLFVRAINNSVCVFGVRKFPKRSLLFSKEAEHLFHITDYMTSDLNCVRGEQKCFLHEFLSESEAPSTRTRVNLKPGKYFHGYEKYRVHT